MDVSRNAPRALVAAVVLVAFVLLPGVMVVGVMASSAVPSQSAPGYPQVDAEFEALIVVRTFIDADGNLDTEVDQTFVEWKFVLETDATITDNAGDNRWAVSYGSSGALMTLTEVAQEGFELLGAFCVEPTSGYSVGELNGESLTVQLQVVVESAEYVCEFINTPSPEGGVGGETAHATEQRAPAHRYRRVHQHPDRGRLARDARRPRGHPGRRPCQHPHRRNRPNHTTPTLDSPPLTDPAKRERVALDVQVLSLALVSRHSPPRVQ